MIFKNKRINLVTYNHKKIEHISDQVYFVEQYCQKNSIELIVSKWPVVDMDILVIENFEEDWVLQKLISFKKLSPNSKIIALLTEHIDLINNCLLFHGLKFDEDGDYMPREVRINRIIGILKFSALFDGFVRILKMPELIGFEKIVGKKNLLTIYPPPLQKRLHNIEKPFFDLIFYGSMTPHRIDLLKKLSERYKVLVIDSFVSDQLLIGKIQSARMVLNIPQSVQWPWISPMRVFKALQAGRATINFGTLLEKNAGIFIKNILNDSDGYKKLDAVIENYQLEYEIQLEMINKMLLIK